MDQRATDLVDGTVSTPHDYKIDIRRRTCGRDLARMTSTFCEMNVGRQSSSLRFISDRRHASFGNGGIRASTGYRIDDRDDRQRVLVFFRALAAQEPCYSSVTSSRPEDA